MTSLRVQPAPVVIPVGEAPQRASRLALAVFLLAAALAACGVLSTPAALAAGLVFGLTVVHPFPATNRRAIKLLLQASVVCLGFGMDLGEVVRVGRSGFLYTAAGIALALALGTLLGRLLRVPGLQSFLISAGTAICGGSAIAALGPATGASEEAMAVSLTAVFVLNAAALLIFPAIGQALHLSESQFGLWAALAIHDTSSVVGAAARYGPVALTVGTTVKLARALWILPVSAAAAAVARRRALHSASGPSGGGLRMEFPWFILLFVLAALLGTEASTRLPASGPVWLGLAAAGRRALAVVLFLIGTSITRQTLRTTGFRPMIQALLLWLLVAGISLAAIRNGIVHL